MRINHSTMIIRADSNGQVVAHDKDLDMKVVFPVTFLHLCIILSPPSLYANSVFF